MASDSTAIVAASTEIRRNVQRVLESTGSGPYARAAAKALATIEKISDYDNLFLRAAAIVMIHNDRDLECGTILCSKLLKKALDDNLPWNDIAEIIRYEIQRGSLFLLLKILLNLPPATNFCQVYVLAIARMIPRSFNQAIFKELRKGGKNHAVYTLLSRFFVLEKLEGIDYSGILEKAIESPFLEYGSRDERYCVAQGLDKCISEVRKSFPEKQLSSSLIMKSVKFMIEVDAVEPAVNIAVEFWDCLEIFEKVSVGIRLSRCLDKGMAPFSNGAANKGTQIMFSLQGIAPGIAIMLQSSIGKYIIRRMHN